MERDELHELSAAYALDALGPHDAAVFEEHLSGCPRCRADLASFSATAGQLALAAPGVGAPPSALRERILVQARAESENVFPLVPRRRFRLAVAASGIAASAALAFGIWAALLSGDLADERAAGDRNEEIFSVLADADARHVPLLGASGSLVVADSGRGALVLENLESSPEGKVYTAWVSSDGEEMLHAGSFHAGAERTVVPLDREVPQGGLVAVTLEDEGADPNAPSGDPIITSDTA